MFVGTALLVTCPRGEILLAKRRDGRWGLPGGKMEDGESLLDAITRETLEETGLSHLDITPTGYVSSHENFICIWFYAGHPGFSVPHIEHDELGPKTSHWTWFKKLPDPLMPGIPEAIHHFKQHHSRIHLEHFNG